MESISPIKSILKSPEVLSILAECLYMPTIEKLNEKADSYINNENLIVYGFYIDDTLYGLIALDTSNPDEIVIDSIAVDKEKQHSRIGKKLINYAIETLAPKVLLAETDDAAVNFYRKLGFQITCLGEKYPNCMRYECRYNN